MQILPVYCRIFIFAAKKILFLNDVRYDFLLTFNRVNDYL